MSLHPHYPFIYLFSPILTPHPQREGIFIHPTHRMHHDVTQRGKTKVFFFFFFLTEGKNLNLRGKKGQQRKKKKGYYVKWWRKNVFWSPCSVRVILPTQQTDTKWGFFMFLFGYLKLHNAWRKLSFLWQFCRDVNKAKKTSNYMSPFRLSVLCLLIIDMHAVGRGREMTQLDPKPCFYPPSYLSVQNGHAVFILFWQRTNKQTKRGCLFCVCWNVCVKYWMRHSQKTKTKQNNSVPLAVRISSHFLFTSPCTIFLASRLLAGGKWQLQSMHNKWEKGRRGRWLIHVGARYFCHTACWSIFDACVWCRCLTADSPPKKIVDQVSGLC